MKSKTKKLFIIIMLSIVTISTFSMTAYSDAKQLFSTTVKQAKTNWCWAASAENLIWWEMTPTRTQWDAVSYIKGNIYDGPYPNVGGTLNDVRVAAEYISKWTESYSYYNYAVSFNFLRNEIFDYSNKVALALGYYNSSGVRTGGHIVTPEFGIL